ncbi:MAG TPA: biotin/lipoyl-containing protein, partial [Cyclobacteriaceae bacterium]|nr:biotin/lipoyl-containing protein [Cyclobacteriaceae bacterium]
MAQAELIMPKMGESIMEATILKWLKKPGDKIEQDESVLEVATDKVDTEVPSVHAGILKEILAKEGEVVKVGKPIAIITTEAKQGKAEEPVTEPVVAASAPVAEVKSAPVIHASTNGNGHSKVADYKSSSRFYSPLVKNIAKEEGIAVAELETISGSGLEGRVTKKDILGYVQNRKLGISITSRSVSAAPLVPASINAGDEIIQMDRMRKMIAERMVDSKRISPHVTSFVEADVTNIVFWRNKMKNEFQKREGDALTFTPIFIDAVVRA